MNQELTAAKAYAALVGAVVTALLGTVPPHTTLWTVLTFAAAVCTAVATFSIPNKPKNPVERGAVDVVTVLVVVVLVVVLLILLGFLR